MSARITPNFKGCIGKGRTCAEGDYFPKPGMNWKQRAKSLKYHLNKTGHEELR